MISAKIILRESKVYSDGKSPICIRIIINRKSIFYTIAKIEKKHWDSKKLIVKSGTPNFAEINNLIVKEISEVHKQIYNFGNDVEGFKEWFNTRNNSSNHKPMCLIELMNKFINDKTNANTIVKYSSQITKLKWFTGETYPINKVNLDWICKYERFLKTEVKNSTNTINKAMKTLCACFNYAIKRGMLDKNPFEHYDFKKEPTLKLPLTLVELDKLQNLDLSNNKHLSVARDAFFISLYLRGSRVSDIIQLKKSYIVNDRIIYKASKDKDLHKIKIIPQLKEILDKYIQYHQGEYILPYFNFKENPSKKFIENEIDKMRIIGNITVLINKRLKELCKIADIDKKVTFHTARHTFASLATQGGTPVPKLQKMFGHSNIATTQTYIDDLMNYIELDEYAENVFTKK